MRMVCKKCWKQARGTIYNTGVDMKVSFKIMTADQAWHFVRHMHAQYHTQLKRFGYDYDRFIPQWPFLEQMFENPNPTAAQIKQYRTKFMQGYHAEHLHARDDVLENHARPALEQVAETLAPFAEKWGVKIPDEITVLVTYGDGGSYDPMNSQIILRATRMPTGRVAKVLQHELVHIIIEKDIIGKYNVPQDLKERIVDIICQEYFGKEPQEMFLNSFANKYITRTAIETDLPGAVKRMMGDFVAFNQKIADANGMA